MFKKIYKFKYYPTFLYYYTELMQKIDIGTNVYINIDIVKGKQKDLMKILRQSKPTFLIKSIKT